MCRAAQATGARKKSPRRARTGPAPRDSGRACPMSRLMTYKARKFWSAVVLVVGLPVYVVVAATVVGFFDRPHFLVEALIYLVLGILWALPLKPLFKGIGKPDPDGGG